MGHMQPDGGDMAFHTAEQLKMARQTTGQASHIQQSTQSQNTSLPYIPLFDESSLAQPETPLLPAVLHTGDLTIFMLLIVLFLSNVNGVQLGGPATFIYWALGLAVFFIPGAYVTRWLAQRFPGQGAPYLWAAHALGPNWRNFAAFIAWLPGVLSVVSAIEASFTFIQYLEPTWFVTIQAQCIAILLVLVTVAAITCLPLRLLKRILFVLGSLYVGVYFLIGIAGVVWLLAGHIAAVHFNQSSQWHLSGGNFAVFGLVVMALLGVDIPLFMGGEIRGGKAAARRASRYVWWGIGLAALAYVGATFGLMVVVPPSQTGALTSSVQAIALVFGQTSGYIVAGILAVSQITIAIAYMLMFSRLIFIVAQDGTLSQSLKAVNRYGVPVLSIIVQAAIVAGVTVLSFVIIPLLFSSITNTGMLAFDIYNVLMAGASALWSFSTALLFFFAIALCVRRTDRKLAFILKRKRFVLVALSLVGIIASLIGIWSTISSSWLPDQIPNQRWAILICGVVILSFGIGRRCSEIPRLKALLHKQQNMNNKETELRSQLQEAYTQQQELLMEVDRLYREQTQAAVTDAVTGLPNHRAIMSKLNEEVERCKLLDTGCAVLFVDLDHFKHINDTWGHRAGDAILHEMGARLHEATRQEDFVGRYGGEEFAVILTDVTIGDAMEAAERLRIIIAEQPYQWQVEGTETIAPIVVTSSIGVSIYKLHGIGREALLESADQGMYKAKKSGRNCVCLADIEVETIPGEKVQRDEETRQKTQPLIPTQTVQALVAASAAHDRSTDDHAHRMVQYAEATGRMLGRPQEELHLLRLAALLHDVGKIGIPDSILHKPGPLDEREWSVMKRHPEIGWQILDQVGGVFRYLASIIVAHHEHWDGTGYPHKLVGEEIPITARILSVVDSYDAMTSHRSYREPMSNEQACQELQRCAGSQFDPRVVAAFLQVLDEQAAITRDTLDVDPQKVRA
jgi:diguanylate cyclase (GGDEF)-like protein